MNKRLKIAGIFALIFFVVALVSDLFLWRFASYKLIQRSIEAGNENQAIQLLVAKSKNPLFTTDWTPRGALPNWEWLEELDERYFRSPTSPGNWWPLLHHAAGRGQSDLVTALLANGASVSLTGDHGLQALHAGVGGGNTNVLAALLRHGADIHASNGFATVIHGAAAFSRNPDVIEFLIGAGADLSVTNYNGWTPVDFASVWNTNAIPLLLAHGAVTGRNRRVPLPTRSQ